MPSTNATLRRPPDGASDEAAHTADLLARAAAGRAEYAAMIADDGLRARLEGEAAGLAVAARLVAGDLDADGFECDWLPSWRQRA